MYVFRRLISEESYESSHDDLSPTIHHHLHNSRSGCETSSIRPSTSTPPIVSDGDAGGGCEGKEDDEPKGPGVSYFSLVCKLQTPSLFFHAIIDWL